MMSTSTKSSTTPQVQQDNTSHPITTNTMHLRKKQFDIKRLYLHRKDLYEEYDAAIEEMRTALQEQINIRDKLMHKRTKLLRSLIALEHDMTTAAG